MVLKLNILALGVERDNPIGGMVVVFPRFQVNLSIGAQVPPNEMGS